MEQEIHEFQLSILRELLFKPNARFRDLKKVDIENYHFTFHLKRLVKEGLVLKNKGRYKLSTKGKEFANRIDTDTLNLERQAKVAIALHAVRENKGKTEYLIHKRLKEPFFGWYGSHSGKIKWGETPIECAKREFSEETGLTGKFRLKGIVHYHHFHKDGKLLEDKYFWVFKINRVRGKLKEKVEEGENIWMTEEEYKSLDNVFASFEEMTKVLDAENLIYENRNKFVESY